LCDENRYILKESMGTDVNRSPLSDGVGSKVKKYNWLAKKFVEWSKFTTGKEVA
jgi:hypothetical protein